MAIGFSKKPRGLFGNPGAPSVGATPGYGDGMIEQMRGAPMGMGAPEQAAQQPQGRSTGQRIAGYFADVTAGLAGQQGPYAAQLQQERDREQKLADAQRQRAEQFTDWKQREQWSLENKPQDTQNTQYFDDNAGNRYAYDPATGSQRLIFTDPNDKQFIQDGQLVTVPNVVRQGQQAQAPATLPADFGFDAPPSPNMANTPAHGLNPTSLSAAQYQAIVAVKGKAATDAWAARNGVRIEGR